MSTKGKIPHIDLDNFEDKKFENCDYILTSPLSLQACKNLNLRPIELLPKETEILSTEIENERKSNLNRARAERYELIENMKKQSLEVNGHYISPGMEKADKSDDQSWDGTLSDKDTGFMHSQSSCSRNSYMKEISFQQKRRQIRECEKEDQNDLKRTIEMKLSRAAKNREIMQQKRFRQIEDKREQFENKVKNVSARRRRLDTEIQNYNRELERFQKLSLEAAAEKCSSRLHCELSKIQSEREQKDSMNRYKRELLNEETEIRTQDLMHKIVEQDRQDEEFMRRKLEKMMESRCYANEAQKLRDELRAVYNLDSFDKKVTNVEAVNRVLK